MVMMLLLLLALLVHQQVVLVWIGFGAVQVHNRTRVVVGLLLLVLTKRRIVC